MQAGNDWGTDSTLQEVEHHQGEGVGGESLEACLIDFVVLGPHLHCQDQGPHPVVYLRVAVQEVGVPNAS